MADDHSRAGHAAATRAPLGRQAPNWMICAAAFMPRSAWRGQSPGASTATAAAALGKTARRQNRDFANRAATARAVPGHALGEPQDSARSRRIGTVFEQQRLYNAGIGAAGKWRAGRRATAHDPQIRLGRCRILTVDLAVFRGGCCAACRRETATDRLPVRTGSGVDDFRQSRIREGVRAAYLYDAGIRTYAALAAATPEQLAEMYQAPLRCPANYEGFGSPRSKAGGLRS